MKGASYRQLRRRIIAMGPAPGADLHVPCQRILADHQGIDGLCYGHEIELRRDRDCTLPSPRP